MPELYAEYTEGSSNKYYRVEWTDFDGRWRLHYGRIGDEGTFKEKDAGTPQAAEQAARKQFRTKIRKGYVQLAKRPDGAVPNVRPLQQVFEKPESTGASFKQQGRSLL